MKKAGVAILGLGVVGGGTLEILLEKKKQIADEYGVDLTVVAVLDKFKDKVLKYGLDTSICADSIDDICDNPDVDIVVECMGGLEPARTFLIKALEAGKSIVTSNKEMFAKSWVELEQAAAKTGAGLYYEATTGGGMPIIRVMTQAMQANSIMEIKAIINGTTNYILSKMTQEGADYAEVLKDAQALGYAEANPVADVEGYDSSYKLSILSSLAFNKRLPVELISREGITNITKTDIAVARELGFVIKLLAIAKRRGEKIEARVTPVFLSKDHPLANVNDSFNAVFLVGDNVGDIMLYGRGAGALPTGSAIVSDIVFCARQEKHARYSEMNVSMTESDIEYDYESEYYIRLDVHDVVGVIADIAAVFKKHRVSISQMRQADSKEIIPVVFVTHKTREFDMQKAIEEIGRLGNVIGVRNVIRVER
ncbi:MAG TPA: homoserine dehydrogenase [Candidatus Ornithoclostridium excrementipullorum]|nr:homoserine dehydrogenase [Candidatus Ornithoclostridium excrementipullorum]